jgi:type II secretory pathway component PulF
MNLNVTFAKLQFGAGNRLRAYGKIATMLDNGVGIDQILKELYDIESDEGRKKGEAMAIVYQEWRNVIHNGGRFADAIDGWIPVTERMILLAGESSGELPKALRSVIRVVKASNEIRSAVIGGLLYPAILLAATLAYLFLFGTRVIPEFTRILDVSKWGKLAYSLYQLSEFVIAYGAWLIAGIVVMIAIVVASLPRWRGSGRVTFDKLPPYSLYRLVVGSGFMLALASMLSSSGRIQDALKTMLANSSPYLAERIDAFLFGLNSGLDAGEAMRTSGYDFPSRELVSDLGIYARHSGDFAEAINKVANEWMETGLDAVRAQMKIISGLAIGIIAGTLMWIVGGFFAIQQEIAAMSRSMGG